MTDNRLGGRPFEKDYRDRGETPHFAADGWTIKMSPGYIDLFAFRWWHPGPMELVIIATIAILLFGKRLPEIGRRMEEFRRHPDFRKRWFIASKEMEERARRTATETLFFFLVMIVVFLVVITVIVLLY